MTDLLFQSIAAAFVCGALLAWLVTFLALRHRRAVLLAEREIEAATLRERCARIPDLEEKLRELQEREMGARTDLAGMQAQLEEVRKVAGEKLALIEQARKSLADAFAGLSAEALQRNNQTFVELAEMHLGKFQQGAKADLEKRQEAIDQLVNPVRQSLEKVDARIGELEKIRAGAYESIRTQLQMMAESQAQLRGETSNLVKALRSPITRGRWGEIQLRRVVEMAGMLDHCDFFEQESAQTDSGRLRPDMLVRLPAGKTVVVDSKAPLQAYLEALEAPDETQRQFHLKLHAAQVRAHIEALTRKAYWEQFQPAPEFVVLFLPGETFFSAALEQDPSLIEFGADKRVILATPTTLIALLRAVFYGWRQEKLARNAAEISALGREIFKRLSDMGTHLDRLGRNLNTAVESYNKAVGTMETRVLVTARKFQALEAASPGDDIPVLEPVEQVTRSIQAPELLEEPGSVTVTVTEKAG